MAIFRPELWKGRPSFIYCEQTQWNCKGSGPCITWTMLTPSKELMGFSLPGFSCACRNLWFPQQNVSSVLDVRHCVVKAVTICCQKLIWNTDHSFRRQLQGKLDPEKCKGMQIQSRLKLKKYPWRHITQVTCDLERRTQESIFLLRRKLDRKSIPSLLFSLVNKDYSPKKT